MNNDTKIDIATDAAGALIDALEAHLISAGRQRRKAAIKEANQHLKRLKMACNPNAPFTWSLYSDSTTIDADRETRENVKTGLREMVERMGQGQSAGRASLAISEGLANRYLKQFGELIGIPDLPTLFADYSQEVEHVR